jgi:hypothetical protein
MKIDITYNVYTDANGGDPDCTSATLRSYHKTLWSKPLPNGRTFELDKKSGAYLYHISELGEFYLGSDAITHSYRNQKRKQWLFKQLSEEKLNGLFRAGSTVGSYIIFPNKKIDGKHTINQARGIHPYIDDRFDLTLECIRLFYSGQQSPLYETFIRYKDFFDLFENFKGYINFFLLNDLVDENENIMFYLPFDSFTNKPTFADVNDYLFYREGVMNFIKARNRRIDIYANKPTTEQKYQPLTAPTQKWRFNG